MEATRTSYGRRRRYSCVKCPHRWTVTFTHEEEAAFQTSPTRTAQAIRRLDDEGVLLVLTSDEPSRAIARRLGISSSLIRRIRVGLAYADALPEVPRRKPERRHYSTCLECLLHTGDARRPCSLGLPEADSIMAGRNCSAFYPADLKLQAEAC